MQKATLMKKRPCRICRQWFTPNPRVKDRQKTCGGARCKREWHKRKCKEWNDKNTDYFRAIYLARKLDAFSCTERSSTPLHPKPQFNSALPHEVVQEVFSIKHLIIIEYFGQLLLKRFQEVLRRQVIVNTWKGDRVIGGRFSRCDRL